MARTARRSSGHRNALNDSTQGPSNATPSTSNPRKRKPDAFNRSEHESGQGPRKRTTTIAEMEQRTRYVDQEVIEKEWKPLPEPMQNQVKEIITAAKRVALGRTSNLRARAEADAVLERVATKLAKRVPRMPFPLQALKAPVKGGWFDGDGSGARNRALEAELRTITHAAELLKAEIAREEVRLRESRQALGRLKSEAVEETKTLEQRANNVHPVLQRLSATTNAYDGADSIGFTPSGFPDDHRSEVSDPSWESLLSHLREHLKRAQVNRRPMEGNGNPTRNPMRLRNT
ncbi:hypothetical protein EJ06DRAFT_283764 [Trichodelitschia bisporula]|uniref:Uncharacterized protein n=1 Tax=Trichodelitschia bisporula TaxID=703511 RepID=A0A6G1I695_9PEZI|nr:hypothetical protein EJ06DRAFT_283764 [Trichodelitschia bisporula]